MEKCIDKRMTKMQLKDAAHISYNAMAKMGKNKPVSLETLEKVCRVLECNVGDVIEFDINKEGKKYQMSYLAIDDIYCGSQKN